MTAMQDWTALHCTAQRGHSHSHSHSHTACIDGLPERLEVVCVQQFRLDVREVGGRDARQQRERARHGVPAAAPERPVYPWQHRLAGIHVVPRPRHRPQIRQHRVPHSRLEPRVAFVCISAGRGGGVKYTHSRLAAWPPGI
jgi:hypothetical protein